MDRYVCEWKYKYFRLSILSQINWSRAFAVVSERLIQIMDHRFNKNIKILTAKNAREYNEQNVTR